MLLKDGFIKKDKIFILSESHRHTDLFTWDLEIQKFEERLELIKSNSIIGFIGKFGTGKTTFLNQLIQKEISDTKWIEFNAWKYPERQNLRENFVLEFARSIDEKSFDNALSKIDGTKGNSQKKLLDTGIEFLSQITQIKAFDGLKHFSHFINSTPAKRTFQLEELLKEIIHTTDNVFINIIVEDIDRSGDEGVYFLETLHYFINSSLIPEKIIKVIVPIGNERYQTHLDQYGKCIDIINYFNPSEVKFEKFVAELFDNEIIKTPHLYGQICSFLEQLFKQYSIQLTIRKIKKVIIAANNTYILLTSKYGEVIDIRMCILIESMKVIFNGDGENLYNQFIKKKQIDEDICESLIYCILQENHRIKGQKQTSILYDKHDGNGKINKSLFSIKMRIEIVENTRNDGSPADKDHIWYITNNFSNAAYVGISNVYFN